MISNEVYNELKTIKENKNMSFSELIKDLVESKSCKGANLKKFLGILHKDKEYSIITKKLKKEWSIWQKRYV